MEINETTVRNILLTNAACIAGKYEHAIYADPSKSSNYWAEFCLVVRLAIEFFGDSSPVVKEIRTIWRQI